MSDNRTERAIRFMENLKHAKGKEYGRYISLWTWQRHVTSLILRYSKNRNNEYCDHRDLKVAGPMKIGKTTLAAALGLYLLCGDDEPNAVVLGVSDTNSKARLIFDTARDMIEQDKHLVNNVRIKCNSSEMQIEYLPTGGVFIFGSVRTNRIWHKDPSAIIYDGLADAATPENMVKLQDTEIYERPEQIRLFFLDGVESCV